MNIHKNQEHRNMDQRNTGGKMEQRSTTKSRIRHVKCYGITVIQGKKLSLITGAYKCQ